MNLSTLKPAKGSVRGSKRIGRGAGSGKGGTSTKGHKGHQSRAGYDSKPGFEGGQMALQRRVPKFGFKNLRRKEFAVVNLDTIEKLAKGDKNLKKVDTEILFAHGLISKKDSVVKILGRGKLSAALEISAHKFSESAKKAIASAGGKITELKS